MTKNPNQPSSASGPISVSGLLTPERGAQQCDDEWDQWQSREKQEKRRYVLVISLLVGIILMLLSGISATGHDLGTSGASLDTSLCANVSEVNDHKEVQFDFNYSAAPLTDDNAKEKQMIDDADKLDYFIAGFPKCGTTSLKNMFRNHNETDMAGESVACGIDKAKYTDKKALSALSTILNDLSQSHPVSIKRGIKCPTSIYDALGIQRLASIGQDTKLIIGVRHPVLFFQSYYNYRVKNTHHELTEKEIAAIPKPESLIGSKEWMGLSTDRARFELPLMQLAKTELTPNDLKEMGSKGFRLAPTPFKVFIYSVEQLEDPDEEREDVFRNEMQQFLGLKYPIKPFPHKNVDQLVGDKGFPETIDICDSRFSALRAKLVQHGDKTQQWIIDRFIKSSDVTVGVEDHFVELLRTWSTDPCDEL